jgi:hypothetical protein
MMAPTGSVCRSLVLGLVLRLALLLVLASILGFVFESNPDLQRRLLDSTLERMPVIGPQVSGDIGTLTGSALALEVAVVGALWTGLGVTLAIGTALDRTWDVPPLKQAGLCQLAAAGPTRARIGRLRQRARKRWQSGLRPQAGWGLWSRRC